MKKYGIVICMLTVVLVAVLNVNTYLSKMDKSYNLALSNIEALADNEGPKVGEDGGISVRRCAKRITDIPGSSRNYLKCNSSTESHRIYPCIMEYIAGISGDAHYDCYE